MPIHITEEANRCLNCKVPQCQKACPVHTPIPKVIQMFKQHQVAEAGQMLFDNNPMSAMCSIVCNHEAQCQGHCVLGRKGSPVHFSAIENYVSGTYLDRMKVQKAEPNGKKVAVVGSGPAGLTAAIKLAEAGCDVTIFERSQCIGGVMEYGIPDFRLPRSYVDRLHHHMDEMGIHVRANTDVGDSIRLQDMLSDGYDAVFVGTGAGRARKLGTPGETRADVQFGIDYLVHPTSTQVGKTVAVIGAATWPWMWRAPCCATAPSRSRCTRAATTSPPTRTRWSTPSWTARRSCAAMPLPASTTRDPTSTWPSSMRKGTSRATPRTWSSARPTPP